MSNDKMRYIVRVIVAAYLFYLSYQIVQSGITSGEVQGAKLVVLYIAVIGFIAAGCFFLWQAYQGFRKIREESEQARNELSAERAEEAREQMRRIEAAEEDVVDAEAAAPGQPDVPEIEQVEAEIDGEEES